MENKLNIKGLLALLSVMGAVKYSALIKEECGGNVDHSVIVTTLHDNVMKLHFTYISESQIKIKFTNLNKLSEGDEIICSYDDVAIKIGNYINNQFHKKVENILTEIAQQLQSHSRRGLTVDSHLSQEQYIDVYYHSIHLYKICVNENKLILSAKLVEFSFEIDVDIEYLMSYISGVLKIEMQRIDYDNHEVFHNNRYRRNNCR